MSKKRYKVCCWETVGGYMHVEAESEDEASEMVFAALEAKGSEAIDDTTNREYQTCGVDEV